MVMQLKCQTIISVAKVVDCIDKPSQLISSSPQALIPGRPAPVLIKEDTVKAMKPGSVIVDMAVEAGGNCLLSELDKTVLKHGVHLVGIANIPGLVAANSSTLYARNVMNFLNLMLNQESSQLKIDRSDEIISGTLVCADGEVVIKS